jgi:hypothetical protein
MRFSYQLGGTRLGVEESIAEKDREQNNAFTILTIKLKPPCEWKRAIMGQHFPSNRPASPRRQPGDAHENPEAVIRPTAHH